MNRRHAHKHDGWAKLSHLGLLIRRGIWLPCPFTSRGVKVAKKRPLYEARGDINSLQTLVKLVVVVNGSAAIKR